MTAMIEKISEKMKEAVSEASEKLSADHFQQKIKPGHFRFAEIQMEIGIPPSITLQMVPQ
jgi:hypothetical protein